MQMMDGSIEVKSKKNQGTIVEISFQLTTGKMDDAAAVKPHISAGMLQGRRILLVEDNDFNRAVARKTLERYRGTVVEAVNGKVSVELLAVDREFDLILMDLQMPEMDGIEATKHLKETLGIKIPVIALTSNAFKSEIELCRQVGFIDYVTKPFEEHVLINVIAQNLDPRSPGALHPAAEPLLYDLSNLRAISSGDSGFVTDMIKLFIEQTNSACVQMRQALTEKNYLLLSQLAHKIKPSIDNMGIASLKQPIRRLESQSKQLISVDEIPALLGLTSDILTRVVRQLELEIPV
jgi:CheY-like chemotaxis protein